jgi:hypothetical protein
MLASTSDDNCRAAFLRVSGVLRNAVGAHLFSLERNCHFWNIISVLDKFHLPAFFPKFRMPSTFSSNLLRTTSKASF